VTGAPIRVSVRLLDDDGAPWPARTNDQFAGESDGEHRLTVAPAATGADLGQALRQVIARELALYPVTWAEALGRVVVYRRRSKLGAACPVSERVLLPLVARCWSLAHHACGTSAVGDLWDRTGRSRAP
jgi:hypothetical protein